MNFKSTTFILRAVALNSSSAPPPEEAKMSLLLPARQALSAGRIENWTGMAVAQHSQETTFQDSGEAAFGYPKGPKGWIKHGVRTANEMAGTCAVKVPFHPQSKTG